MPPYVAAAAAAARSPRRQVAGMRHAPRASVVSSARRLGTPYCLRSSSAAWRAPLLARHAASACSSRQYCRRLLAAGGWGCEAAARRAAASSVLPRRRAASAVFFPSPQLVVGVPARPAGARVAWGGDGARRQPPLPRAGSRSSPGQHACLPLRRRPRSELGLMALAAVRLGQAGRQHGEGTCAGRGWLRYRPPWSGAAAARSEGRRRPGPPGEPSQAAAGGLGGLWRALR